MTAAAPALLVFAKEPVPGHVKTRLAASIGNEGAAAAYRELTALTLGHAVHAHQTGIVDRIELWCAPSPDSAYFRALAADCGGSLHTQSGADLGERMEHAIADALTRAASVMLIGTDCPVLDATRLALAHDQLDEFDAVLGPAEDGGYVLVGSRVPLDFGATRWSSPHAFADTVAAFAATGIRWTELPVSWDVDTPADLARFYAAHLSV